MEDYEETGIPEQLIHLVRSLYSTEQEVKVRIMQGNTDWFKIEKGVGEGFILSPII